MKIKKICKECGKEFEIDKKFKNKLFCDSSCYFSFRRKHSTKKEYVCEQCGRVFIGRKTMYKHHFCSSECYKQYKKSTDLRINFVNDNYFTKFTNSVAWILGILASDGNINKNFISISQSGDNGKDCVSYIKRELSSTAPITITKPKNGKTVYSLTINSKQIVKDLSKYNIVPNKTYSYFLPIDILKKAEHFRYFLWGYIDGDGCIGIYNTSTSKDNLHVSFVCSKNMLDSIINFLPFNPIFHKQKSVWCVAYNGEKAYRFLTWLFKKPNTIFKSYKYRTFERYKNTCLNQKRFYKYENLYKKCSYLFGHRKDLNCIKISELLKIPFQTVYTYKHRWEEENEIRKM